ncbi:hypothetical protein [Flavihumibacter petaseus]|uniref:Uncharacterized protein n=1 Tax=Flavihumibacter petaseus NBRC 106054 TaxID=1220578 RepID=A0A0E9N3Q1_9BACT|nr:hypothetical protein [Flavihumibacter petaseus]GAO44439.1 hypothetical protein FPE01S_03_04760 [Flavihumibacter petaseus NBRC 106054]
MRVIFGIFFWLLIYHPVKAQVVISPQLPSPGVFTKPQLWNVSILNSGKQAFMVRLQLTITEVNTNQLVLSGVTRNFQMPVGASQITHNDVMPVIYQDANPTFQVDNTPNGFLPVGVFNICYALVYQQGDAVETLAEECLSLEVEPLSPPQLVLPADSERVNTARPMFSWTPPMPYTFFSNLSYDFQLVEVASYQTAAEAIQVNVPLFRKPGILQTQLQYPQGLPALDTGKLYAWRVAASNNTAPVGFSEIWSFRVEAPSAVGLVKETGGSYLSLSSAENNSQALVMGKLLIAYDNRENDKTMVLSIQALNQAGQQTEALVNNILPLRYGKNLLQFDLEANAHLNDKSIYRLTAVTGGKKMYLTFQYRRP